VVRDGADGKSVHGDLSSAVRTQVTGERLARILELVAVVDPVEQPHVLEKIDVRSVEDAVAASGGGVWRSVRRHPAATLAALGTMTRLSSRPRVVAVISAPTFVRNFVETGALDALRERHDLAVIAPRAIAASCPDLERHPCFAGWFDTDAAIERRHHFLFNVLMWRHRALTGAFRFRARRVLGAEYLFLARASAGHGRRTWAVRKLVRQLAQLRVLAMVGLGSRLLATQFTRAYIKRRLPVNDALRSALRPLEPDVLLFPSSAYDPIGNDVSRIGAEVGVPSVFLIDNWDNLSSKTLFWTKPDHVGVWGPQSREHAEQIQRFAPDRVHELGTPRFDSYRAARGSTPAAPIPGRYLLFLGCALPFDELTALRALDEAIDRHPDRHRGLRVVYRPHPARQQRLVPDAFHEDDFRHVVLDPQMRAYVDQRDALPDLDWYGPLLANCELVVAPLTTMVIEALMFNKQVLTIVYDDGIHYTAPNRTLAAYAHFEGIESIDRITFCRSSADLGPMLEMLLSDPSMVSASSTDEQLSWFLCFDDATSYGGRLADLVQKVGGDGSP
jgi:hypothetical protein